MRASHSSGGGGDVGSTSTATHKPAGRFASLMRKVPSAGLLGSGGSGGGPAGLGVPSRYALKEELGRGATGSVFRAVDTLTGAPVAVKRLDRAAKGAPAALAREVRALAACPPHPHVVRYEAAFAARRHVAVVLEYCAHGSLDAAVGPRGWGPAPEVLAAAAVGQVLAGLAHLHGPAGLAHRDVKGANVLISEAGLLKLADFGIATAAATSSTAAASAAGGDGGGSPYWMSPEAVEGTPGAPPTAADVWAAGCLAVELVTGCPPYADLTPVAALFRIVQDEDGPPRPGGASAEMRSFLDAAWERDPAARPAAATLAAHPWVAGAGARLAFAWPALKADAVERGVPTAALSAISAIVEREAAEAEAEAEAVAAAAMAEEEAEEEDATGPAPPPPPPPLPAPIITPSPGLMKWLDDLEAATLEGGGLPPPPESPAEVRPSSADAAGLPARLAVAAAAAASPVASSAGREALSARGGGAGVGAGAGLVGPSTTPAGGSADEAAARSLVASLRAALGGGSDGGPDGSGPAPPAAAATSMLVTDLAAAAALLAASKPARAAFVGAGGADALVDAALRGGPRTAFGALRAARALLTGAAPASRRLEALLTAGWPAAVAGLAAPPPTGLPPAAGAAARRLRGRAALALHDLCAAGAGAARALSAQQTQALTALAGLLDAHGDARLPPVGIEAAWRLAEGVGPSGLKSLTRGLAGAGLAQRLTRELAAGAASLAVKREAAGGGGEEAGGASFGRRRGRKGRATAAAAAVSAVASPTAAAGHPPLASPPVTPHAGDVASPPAARAAAARSPGLGVSSASSSSAAALALASLRAEADGDPAIDAAFAAAAEAEAAAAAAAAAAARAHKGRGLFRRKPRPVSAASGATPRQVSPAGSAEGGDGAAQPEQPATFLTINPSAYPPPFACDAASTAAGVHRASNLLLVLACGDGAARRALAGGAEGAPAGSAAPATTLLSLLSAPEGAPLVRRLLRAVRHLADDPAASEGLARAGGLGALVPHVTAAGGAGLDALSALGSLIRGVGVGGVGDGGGATTAALEAGGTAGGVPATDPAAPRPPLPPGVVSRMVATASAGGVPPLIECLGLGPPALASLPPGEAARAARARQLAAPLLADMAGAGHPKLARAGLAAGLPSALMRLTADDPAWAPAAVGGLADWLAAEASGELGGGPGGVRKPLARALSTPAAAAALRSVVRSGAGGVDGRRGGAGVVHASPAELAAVLGPLSRLLASSPAVARAAATAVGPVPVVLRLLALPTPAERRLAAALAAEEGGWTGEKGAAPPPPPPPPATDSSIALPLLDLVAALYGADRAPRDFLARTGAEETLEVLARTRVVRAVTEGAEPEEEEQEASATEDGKGKAAVASVAAAAPSVALPRSAAAGAGIPDIVVPPAVRRRAEALLATFAANAVVG